MNDLVDVTLLLSAIAVQLVADSVRAFIAGERPRLEGTRYLRPRFWNRWVTRVGTIRVAAVMTL